MKDLFISYAHEDSDFAHRLAALLEAAGLSVWWDPQLRAGQDFALKIEEVLQQVGCVVVLWSSHSVDSRWVRAEANEGLRLGKLVPAALDESVPPLVFRAIHTAQLGGDDLTADNLSVQKLIVDLREMLGKADDGGPLSVLPTDGPAYPWRYPAALAAVVFSLLLLLALFDIPARLLDWVTGALAGSPLHLAPLTTELALVVSSVLFALSSGWRLYRTRFRGRVWQAAMGLTLLVAVASVYTWGERAINPAPDHLGGRIVHPDWSEMRVAALNAQGRPLSLGEVPVSTENGEFGMRLAPVFADRPRTLAIFKPGCAELRKPVVWAQWRAGEGVIVNFSCGARND